jgi:transposase
LGYGASPPEEETSTKRCRSPAFSKLYAREGRPSAPLERLLRALLLQAFYTVRSEGMLMEQLEYNPLFRWFVGLSMDDVVWGRGPGSTL